MGTAKNKNWVVYATNINKMVNNENYEKLFEIVSDRAKEKIGKYHFFDDKKRTLCGEILVRYAIKRKKKIANKDILLVTGENGKPYCKNFPEIHYNISHSGEWAVCVISDSPIGVDIEKIGCNDLSIAERFFTENEYKQLLEEENPTEMFYKIWTLKESYIKYTGKGLMIPLNSFEFAFRNHCIRLRIPKNNMLHFKSFKVFEDYYLAVCSERRFNRVEINQIAFTEIRKMLLENK